MPERQHVAEKQFVPEVLVEHAASADISAAIEVALKSLIPAQAELLCVELQKMATVCLDETVQPLHDIAASIQSLVLQLGTILERSEVTLGKLAPVPVVQVEAAPDADASQASPTLLDPPKKLVVNFTDGGQTVILAIALLVAGLLLRLMRLIYLWHIPPSWCRI